MDSKTQDRILKAASDYADKMDTNNDYQNGRKCGCEMGYIAGATAVHDRAQPLIDMLMNIRAFIAGATAGAMHPFTSLITLDKEIEAVLEQWKGK